MKEATTSSIDRFWTRQVRRLVERERAGEDPHELISRGVALSMMVFKKRKVATQAPPTVYRYLDDFDIAAKDLAMGSTAYRERQLTDVEKWLDHA